MKAGPMAYIQKIQAEAQKFGAVVIEPPAEWSCPFFFPPDRKLRVKDQVVDRQSLGRARKYCSQVSTSAVRNDQTPVSVFHDNAKLYFRNTISPVSTAAACRPVLCHFSHSLLFVGRAHESVGY